MVWFPKWTVSKISRHYFVFLFFSLTWLGLFGKDSWIFLITFLFFHFFFSFLSLSLLYYAQDSCKKWQEKIDKLGLICFNNFSSLFYFFFLWWNWVCSDKTSENFSSLFCFSFFFFSFWAWPGWFGQDSRKFLVTILFFFFFLFSILFIHYTTCRIVVKSDKKIKTGSVWFREWQFQKFLVTILFLEKSMCMHWSLFFFKIYFIYN